jgi:hypothetical protein
LANASLFFHHAPIFCLAAAPIFSIAFRTAGAVWAGKPRPWLADAATGGDDWAGGFVRGEEVRDDDARAVFTGGGTVSALPAPSSADPAQEKAWSDLGR